MGGTIDHIQFESIYSRYYARFVIIARRYVRDSSAAEDLVMESFASLWERRNVIDPGTNLPAYIAATVKNNCLNWLNARQLHLSKQQDMHSRQARLVDEGIRSLGALDPERLFTDEIRSIVERETARMPYLTRQVFELSRFGGKTYDEIAAMLGISRRRVTSEMQRALALMRRALEDYLPLQILVWILGA